MALHSAMLSLLPLHRSQAVMHAAREAWKADVRNTQISHFHLQVPLRPFVHTGTPHITWRATPCSLASEVFRFSPPVARQLPDARVSHCPRRVACTTANISST